MKTDIFIITTDGLLEINKAEIRAIKEFKDIIIRDKGGIEVGDFDGRRKLFAFKELMYIHLYYNPGSIYRDLPDDNKHISSKTHALLHDEWTPDKLIKAAGKAYVKLLKLSALHHTYINTNRAVYALGEDIQFFNNLRNKIREKIQEKILQLEDMELEEDIQKTEAEVDRLTERLMNIGSKITAINDKLPSAFNTIEDLKKKLIKENQGGAAMYGGGELNNREK